MHVDFFFGVKMWKLNDIVRALSSHYNYMYMCICVGAFRILTCLITVQNNIVPDDFFIVADNLHSNHMLLACNITWQADILYIKSRA